MDMLIKSSECSVQIITNNINNINIFLRLIYTNQ